MWIIQWYDNDKEEGFFDEIVDCLQTEPYQADKYLDLRYVISEIDINDKKYKSAMDKMGMTSNAFTVTYPVGLMMF